MKSQWNRDSQFLICSVFFVSKGNLFDVYFTTLQLVLVSCGGGRTSPRTLPYCRLFHFLWYHFAHYGTLESGVLLMYTLEGVRSVANFITAYEESPLNWDSHFLICSVFFVSKGNLFDVYSRTLHYSISEMYIINRIMNRICWNETLSLRSTW